MSKAALPVSDLIADTARLSIRRITLDDAAFLLQLLNEPSWIANIGDRGVRTLDDAAQYIEARILHSYRTAGFGMYLLVAKPQQQAIGVCGFFKREALPDVDIGFALLPAFCGAGYALEAATAVMRYGQQTLGFSAVLGITNQDNHRSGLLLEKLGFRYQRLVQLPPDNNTLKLYAFKP